MTALIHTHTHTITTAVTATTTMNRFQSQTHTNTEVTTSSAHQTRQHIQHYKWAQKGWKTSKSVPKLNGRKARACIYVMHSVMWRLRHPFFVLFASMLHIVWRCIQFAMHGFLFFLCFGVVFMVNDFIGSRCRRQILNSGCNSDRGWFALFDNNNKKKAAECIMHE